jgi:hypothetical protein
MPRPSSRRSLPALFFVLLAALPFPDSARLAAQQPVSPPQLAPRKGEYRIRSDVNLVVLHTSVLDERGRFVPGLKQENFRVFEDKVEQKLALFKREDIPVTVGLVSTTAGACGTSASA